MKSMNPFEFEFRDLWLWFLNASHLGDFSTLMGGSCPLPPGDTLLIRHNYVKQTYFQVGLSWKLSRETQQPLPRQINHAITCKTDLLISPNSKSVTRQKVIDSHKSRKFPYLLCDSSAVPPTFPLIILNIVIATLKINKQRKWTRKAISSKSN